jgi:hypothetical protein
LITHTRRPRRFAALATGVALSLAATACGGGDDPADETDTAVTEDNPEEDPAEGFLEQDEEGDGQAEEGAVDETPAEEDGEVTDDGVGAGEQGAEGGAETGALVLTTQLQELNGSGASGTATVDVQGGEVTVTVETNGVAAGAPHAQHIHIGGENTCPTADAAGDDEFVSTPEGQPSYGEIRVSLTTEGDVGAESAVAVDRMPTADDSGTVTYERTFELPEGVTAEELGNGVIVQHGIADTSLGSDPAAYDGPDSPLKQGVPQEATLPALCGELGAG